MLKGIPNVLSPQLLKVLMEMGHGDEIVLADANFPSASLATNLIRLDGVNTPEILDAILQFFPLDHHVGKNVILMAVDPHDSVNPVIWDNYKEIVYKHNNTTENVGVLKRYDFYDRAKKAYAIIATGEKASYANIVLKKGVV